MKNSKSTQAYIIGVALGDGNLSNPNGRAVRLRVTCDKKYPQLISEICTAIQHLFPENRVSTVDRKNCVDISCYSNEWEKLLGWKAKDGSKSKQSAHIPSWILGNVNYSKHCIRGLIQTDGSIYTDRGYIMINYTTIISELADNVSQILSTLGYQHQKRKVVSKGKKKYVIRISKNVENFMQEIHLWKE